MNHLKKIIMLLTVFVVGIQATKEPASVPHNTFLLDTINVVIYDPEGVQVITHSDVTRPSLAGQQRSQDDIVFEMLIFNDAKRHKVLPSEEEVEKYLNAIQRQNNLSAQQLEMVFASAGFTPQEGKEQLSIMQTVNSMMDFKVRSNLIVPRRQVVAYYEANPIYAPEKRIIKRLFVPFSALQNRENGVKEIQKFLKTKRGLADAQWSDEFAVHKDELAPEKQFLFSMEQGAFSKPQEIEDGYELYQLVSIEPQHLVTLEERYRDIMAELLQPLYEQRLEKYRQELFGSAAIVYLHQ